VPLLGRGGQRSTTVSRIFSGTRHNAVVLPKGEVNDAIGLKAICVHYFDVIICRAYPNIAETCLGNGHIGIFCQSYQYKLLMVGLVAKPHRFARQTEIICLAVQNCKACFNFHHKTAKIYRVSCKINVCCRRFCPCHQPQPICTAQCRSLRVRRPVEPYRTN